MRTYIHRILIFIFCLTFSSCAAQEEKPVKQNHAYTNALIHESSPYLLQHAHNPVNWHPWSDDVLQKAKAENKLVIISIGYAACHWCHVMEHESFEDVEVAKYMNDNFVCIKVDREERPDVDQIYMTASQLISGSGGWPLNALALPSGKPFYAGTYFPKENWLKMLRYFVDAQAKNPKQLLNQAEKITQGIRQTENIVFSNQSSVATLDEINKTVNVWKNKWDLEKGGENIAPKFPMPSNWEYLLEYNNLTQNKDALKAVTVTLDHMARGGIYDQLGGGFARYSTDMDWKAPHFEKMLYDNAQLVTLYSHAYQCLQNPLYKKVVTETLEFIETELSANNGGFYSSLDADSEGEEGKYYVWSYDEIAQILNNNAPLFIDYYNIEKAGNWEHSNNILLRKDNENKLIKKYNLTAVEIEQKIATAKKIVLKVRSQRIKPRLDDKSLTAWNALMIKGYLDAYRAFGEKEYKNKALKCANFLIEKMLAKDGELKRNFKNKKASIHGLLDDYAFTIAAFISLYQATFDEQWLNQAKQLNEYVLINFYDKKSGMFFYTHQEYSNLIARKMEVSDNVIPASNSEMAKNLLKLSLYFNDTSYYSISKQMLMNVQNNIRKNVRYYSNWGSLELQFIQAPFEIAIVGKNAQKMRAEFQQNYTPNVIFLGGKTEGTLPLLQNKLAPGSTTIYVCRNKACNLPTTDITNAINQISK